MSTGPAPEIGQAKVRAAIEAAKYNQADAGKKHRPTRILPTDRITFARQLDILRAYGALSGPAAKPITNADVASVVGMTPSTVSVSNAFFADTGLLQRTDKGYVPCPEVLAFQHAYEWNPETASQKLAPVLARTWFADALLPRLGFKPLEIRDAIQCLGEAATAGTEYESQLQVLVNYLHAAGLVEQEDNMVRGSQSRPPESQPTTADPPPTNTGSVSRDPPTRAAPQVSTAFSRAPEGVVQFHISVKVDMAEFSNWSPDRISAFFSGIAQVLAAKGKVEDLES